MKYLFIDFDGVICDSVNEAYISSWRAYYGENEKSADIAGKHLFCSCRPFIKTGSDFMILQDCAAKKNIPKSQEDYNKLYLKYSEEEHKNNFEKFYKSRSFLLENYPDFWFLQNKLYDGIKGVLTELRSASAVFILSTKKSSFINEILKREKIEWPEERILSSVSGEKIPVIESLLKDGDTAVLIEDQAEYFKKHPKISFVLAEWGYVSDLEKASEKADRVISLDDFRDFVSPWIIRNYEEADRILPD